MDSFEISSDSYAPSYDPSMLTNREQPTQPGQPAEEPRNEQQPPQPKRPRQTTKKPQTPSVGATPVNNKSAVTDYGRWKLFAGIFLIILAVYLLISSLSYFANGADDQSIVQGNSY